jgi:hypothetical protein
MQLELIYTHLGYGDLTQPIGDFRAAINSVASAVEVPGYDDYLDGLNVPENQRAEEDDPDFDGVVNVLEYLAGTNALQTSSAMHPISKVIELNGSLYPALEYIHNRNAEDLTVVVQFSDRPDFISLDNSVLVSTELLEEGFERVLVRSGNTVNVGSAFSRLVVSRNVDQN